MRKMVVGDSGAFNMVLFNCWELWGRVRILNERGVGGRLR